MGIRMLIIVGILLLLGGVALGNNTGIALFVIGFALLLYVGLKERIRQIKRRFE
jgi:hypothetical protein